MNILGTLETLEIRPATLTLESGEPIGLRAIGFDANGLQIPSLYVRWSVEEPQAGIIAESGVFIAGPNPGGYENAVKVIAVDVSAQ